MTKSHKTEAAAPWPKQSTGCGRVVDGINVDQWTDAPLRLQLAVQLMANQDDVFALVGDHSAIIDWFPLVVNVSVDNTHADSPGGAGAIRCCTLTNGARMVETIIGFHPPHIYGYAISNDNVFGLEKHLGLLQVAAAGESASILTWRLYFEHGNPVAMCAKLAANISVALHNLVARFGGEFLTLSVL